jgi:uncharacterized repeat protein (TIGR02543 family)
MKNLYKVLNIFALAAVIAILGGCFSPWAGDGATITINVGGGSGRTAFHLLDDDAKARISYMLDLSGPSNMTDVPFASGTQTINLSVTPGIYTITVTAYLDGEVYAAGSTTAEARAGQSTPVNILMSYAGETIEKTFTVTFDSNGGDGDVPQSIQVNAGGNITLPGGDGLSKDGYVFGGWSDDRDGTEESYHVSYPYPITASITLYAVWVEADKVVYVESISIDESTLNLIVGGETETLTATVYPDDATNKAITWSSSDTAVATVSNDGTITAVAAGNTTITVTTADGGFTAQCEVTIYPTDMVRINAGTFMMGSPISEPERATGETQHEVTLTKGFYMGKYQVTQEQYEAVIGSNPSYFQTAVEGETGTPGKLPVEKVSWYDAVEFCNKLSALEGLQEVYTISGRTPASGNPITGATVTADWSKNGYRLPTEAEWEYACRAGTTTAYNTGETISDNTGWYSANSGSKTHQVGLKTANEWGLHDMHGNVLEWCWDLRADYTNEAQNDPTGGDTGSNRVRRGGSWFSSSQSMRSANRFYGTPSDRDETYGFRLVRSLP